MSVIAFRRWNVDRGQLAAIGTHVRWTPGRPITAACLPSCNLRIGAVAHEVPSLTSRCGIWAHKLPIRPCECDHPTAARHGVVGAVRMWGRYVEHEHGWRAEHAEPVALVDFTGHLDPAYPAARYPDLVSLYGEWAPDAVDWAPGEPGPAWCSPWSLAAQMMATYRDAVAASWRFAASNLLFGAVGAADPDTGIVYDETHRRGFAGRTAPLAQPDRQEVLSVLRGRHQTGPWIVRPERSRRRG